MLKQAVDAMVVEGIADEDVKRRNNTSLRGIWTTEDGMVLLSGLFERTESLPAMQQSAREQSHGATSTDPARRVLATLAVLCRADGSVARCSSSSTHLDPSLSAAFAGPFTGGHDTEPRAWSLTNAMLRSLTALVESEPAESHAGTALARESGTDGGRIGKMDDSDNRRKRIFCGALKLLREIAREVEKEGVELVGRCLGQEDTDLVWKVVIVGLTDSWSEIRKLSAAHARSLAAILGPTNARAFYFKTAAECGRIVSSGKVETPRDWKRTHGLLLGMRSALEGASACTGSSSSSCAKQHTELNDSGGKSTPLAEFADDLLAEESASDRDKTQAPSDPVKQQAGSSLSQTTPPGLPTFPVVALEMSLHTPPIPVPPLSTRCIPTTIKPTKAKPTMAPLDVALSFLAHRQSTVQEAAVELLHALALTLGPQAALALYGRILCMLERKHDNKAVFRGGSNSSEPCAAGRDEVETGRARAEERRMRDQAHGALSLLERLLDTLPPETVGESWERVFLVLRSYIDHSVSSLRQAAGAVLLRIAATTGTKVAPSLLSFGPPRNSCVACTTRDRHLETPYDGVVENNVSARIVVSALVTAWQQAEPRSSSSTQCVDSHHVKCLFPNEIVEAERNRNTAGRGPTATGDPKTNPYHDRLAHQQRPGLQQGEKEQQNAEEIGDCEQGPAVECEQQRVPGVCDENVPGENADIIWTFHEGVLMVYEGVLKHMVERCLAGVVPSAMGAPAPTAATAPTAETEAVSVAATESGGDRCNWPVDLVAATPTLRDLLDSVGRQAESALYQAELRREARRVTGEKGEHNLTTVTNHMSPSDGTLELWRAGSQLLPTLAKAMAWWNPAGLLRACERAALVTEATAIKSAQLLLKRRTSLSTACELLRASASHARHLAEVCTDRRQQRKQNLKDSALAGSADGDTAATDKFVAPRTVERAATFDENRILGGGGGGSDDESYVSVTSPERWGSSTDGISDSGSGGRWEERLPGVARSHVDGLCVPVSAENSHAEGIAVVRSIDSGGSSPVAAAQIVRNTLALCRDAPPLLIRALAAVAKEHDESMDFRSGTLKEDGHGIGDTTTSSFEYTYGGNTISTPGEAASLGSPRHLWIFTGVVEALVFAAAFRFGTSLAYSCSQAVSRAAKSSVVPIPSSQDSLWGTGLREGDNLLLEPTPTSAAGHLVVSRHLELLHKEAFPAIRPKGAPPVHGTEPESAASSQASAGSDSIAMGKETAQADGSGHAGEGRVRETAAVNDDVVVSFAVPFSWGSLSIIRTPPSFRDHPGGRKGQTTAAVSPSTTTRAAQRVEVARQAVQLDRLLSARIVRALPGYARSLSRESGSTLIPCLLRWLEARDENVRWISVSPLEARASLLSALHIALSARHSPESSAETTWVEQEKEEEEIADASSLGRDHQQSVAIACVETLTNMISEGRVGPSLFSSACLVARDAVASMLKVSQWSCSAERGYHAAAEGMSGDPNNNASSQHESFRECSPQQERQQRRHVLLSAKCRSKRGVNNSPPCSCAAIVEQVVSPLLNAVAGHLLRWYPQDKLDTEQSANYFTYDGRVPACNERESPPQRVADGASTRSSSFVEAAKGPLDDTNGVLVGGEDEGIGENPAGRDSGNSNSSDSGEGGGNDWDDWDDESDGGEDGKSAPAAGTEVGNNKIAGGSAVVEGKLYTSALASIVDFLSSFTEATPLSEEEPREGVAAVSPGVCRCFGERVERIPRVSRLEDHHQSRVVALHDEGASAHDLEEGKSIRRDGRYTIRLEALLDKLPARHRDVILFAWRRGLATDKGVIAARFSK